MYSRNDAFVGRGLDLRADGVDEAGVERGEAPLQLLAVAEPPAPQADDVRDAPVQVDHRAAACGPMQPVDVLRDRPDERADAFEIGQGVVAGVGPGPSHPRPADVAARPVPLPRLGGAQELAVLHRRDATGAVRAAVVRDAGVGGDAGAGEGDERAAREDVEGPVQRVRGGHDG